MSMNAGTNSGGLNTGGLPRGELLGRYRSYEDAQKVVDHLTAAEDFDVKALTIVGNDLRSVEHIRTRLTYPRVALGGAAQGAMFGAFIGLLIYLFSPEASIYNLAFSVVLGMAIWMIIGVLGFAMRKGRREYASSSQLVATSFDVVCEFGSAQRARQLVAGAGVMSLNAFNDPTSTSMSGAPQQPAGAPRPSPQPGPGQGAAGTEQQGSTTTTAAPDAQASESQAPSAGYNDLPDGRPRYGVRAPQEQAAQEPEPQVTGEQAEQAERAESPAEQTEPAQAERPGQREQPESHEDTQAEQNPRP
ncbi:general stress protein [Nesterenkonia halotolerans]|uniref:general stress protein n=1 Tax=Nesterenkonia halotolerans TaxID=225325 RepID=UPI003EE6EB11